MVLLSDALPLLVIFAFVALVALGSAGWPDALLLTLGFGLLASYLVWLWRRMGELSVAAYGRLGDRPALAEAFGSFAFCNIEVDPAAALALFGEVLEI